MKELLAGIVSILMIVAVGVFAYWTITPFLGEEKINQKPPPQNADDEVCIQVITPARNPETGDIKEFPTPCDVPEGWEIIENEIPGLDLI